MRARTLPHRARAVLAASALALGTPSCLIAPAASVETPHGIVRAPNRELAREAALHVREVRATLERHLPDLRDVRTDVWVQRRAWAGPWVWFQVGSLHAFTMETAGTEHPRIHVPIESYRSSIVHEMVHALLGPSWDTLPAVLEEGLCDYLAVELMNDTERRLSRLIAAHYANELVERGVLSPEEVAPSAMLAPRQSLELHARGKEYASYAYGLGYALATRIVERRGLAGLHRLCVSAAEAGRAQVPARQVLAAAEVSEHTDVGRLVLPDVEAALFAYVAESGELVRVLDELRRQVPAEAWEPEGFRISYDARGVDFRMERRLVDLPGYAEWARAHPAALRAPDAPSP